MNARNRIILPLTGYVRLSQIVGAPGDLEADPPKLPIPAIIPVSKSTWWSGVKSGRFPKSVKLGPRTTCWRISDIKVLIANGLEKPDPEV